MTQPRNIMKSLRVKDWLQVDGDFKSVYGISDSRLGLTEYFDRRPALSADIDQAYTVEVARAASLTFESLGTNATTALATYSATSAGIVLTTAGADNDQHIVLPHLDAGQTAWTGWKWGTENQVVWESAITVGDDITTGVLLWAGLKLTNTPVIATDANQVFFRFSTDDSDTEWVCESSIAGVDTATDSGVTVAINTTYKFRIEMDSDRKAHFFINDKEVANTAALTNDIDFIPYVGIQALSAAAEFVTLHYEKISRDIFE
jgi:hypothetical protein